jgi:hypothetical protein
MRAIRFVVWGMVGLLFGLVGGATGGYLLAGRDERGFWLTLALALGGLVIGPVVGLAIAAAFDWSEEDRQAQPVRRKWP